MKLTNKIRAMIMQWEGCRLKAYHCPAGVLTIGYGHTGPDVTEGMTITAAQAVALFNADIDRFAESVRQLLGETVTRLRPQQFDALVSLAYNIGPGNFRRSSVMAKVKADPDDPTIRDAFMRHVKARDRHGNLITLPGLVRRRAGEADHYFEI